MPMACALCRRVAIGHQSTVQHRQGSEWFREIANVTVERFGTREAALTAETAAIETEKPLYNKPTTPIVRKVVVPVWPPRPEILALQLTGQEKDEMRKAANRAGMPMSVFARTLTMAAIRKGDTVVTTVKAA
jgi:hypothetical protein